MNRFKLSILLFGLAFFTGGLYWGLKGGPHFHLTLSSPTPLSLICKKEWISDSLLKDLEEKLHVKIERLSFSNWGEYSRLLANAQGRFDLLCTHSFLSQDLVQTQWMEELDPSSIEGLRGVSAELKDLPLETHSRHFIPLGWLLNGYAHPKDSKVPLSWDKIWPEQGKKLSMNYPDLELYLRMKNEGLEMDPEMQGRYNRDPGAAIEKFLKNLGSLHSPTHQLEEADFANQSLFQITNAQGQNLFSSAFGQFELLKDGSHLWMLLIGVGAQTSNKELAIQVIDELLTPSSSEKLRTESGFGHVLAYFNTREDVPYSMKPSFIRQFPLRSLQFPEVSLEGVHQWETLMNQNLEKKNGLKTIK